MECRPVVRLLLRSFQVRAVHALPFLSSGGYVMRNLVEWMVATIIVWIVTVLMVSTTCDLVGGR